MFYKIGFYILLIIVILGAGLFIKSNPMKNQGAMSWADIYSENPTATIGFLHDNFGIVVTETSKTPEGQDYNVVKARGQLWPFAGIMEPPILPGGQKIGPQSMIYLTVTDYDSAHAKMMSSGASAVAENMQVDGMKFGIYMIPGGVTIGIAQYK